MTLVDRVSSYLGHPGSQWWADGYPHFGNDLVHEWLINLHRVMVHDELTGLGTVVVEELVPHTQYDPRSGASRVAATHVYHIPHQADLCFTHLSRVASLS